MFEKLIKLVRHEKVSLFIGSGFSIEAGAPSVNELRMTILKELDNDIQREEHQNDQLDVLADYFVNEVCEGSRNELISLMKNIFRFEHKCMVDHRLLASIPHFKTLFTTNYDTLLEDSYPENECRVVRNDIGCTYTDERTSIFKVHGDFIEPDNVVITTSDYLKFKKYPWPNPLMWDEVVSEFTKKHILFIGYSLKDDNIIDIIKRIKLRVGNNQKQMFMIAPNVSQDRQNQLAKLGVTYYNAIAKIFLEQLNQNLNDNISNDFRNGHVSPDTFARFCYHRNYIPTISLENHFSGQNRIEGIKPIPGEKITHKIHMVVSGAYKDKLVSPDFLKDGQYGGEDNGFQDIPYIRLSGDDLIKCSHTVNGVVLYDHISSVIIGPAANDLVLDIRVPSRDFFKQVPAKGYKLNDSNYLIHVDCHIFDMSILMSINEEYRHLSFRFDFKERYKDNDEALKWIGVATAFFSKEDVFIQQLSNTALNLSNSQDIPECPFGEFKTYYENIREIEMLTRQKFSLYNRCTKERYDQARIVLSYLKHEYVSFKLNKKGVCSIKANAKELEEFTKKVKINDTLSLISTGDEVNQINLNDKLFSIPYMHVVMNSCTLKSIEPAESGKLKIVFNNPQTYYEVLYSDKPANIEYPDLDYFNCVHL